MTRKDYFADIYRDLEMTTADFSLLRAQARQIIVDEALKANCHPSQILSKTRTRHVVYARQAIMFRLRNELLGLSLPQIGGILNRDHSTVIYGIDQHAARLNKAAAIETQVNACPTL